MLAEMRIQGLGVIDDATLELDAGLTVLTGETGAGKTMVVTGLTLLGGGRAEASRVADGARRAVVEGRFTADAAALAVADEVGAEADDDGALIAVRTVGADGRSRAHLGGRAVPVGVLARLADSALAVHGQNDQLRLLRPAEQRALLDRFAGDAVGEPLAAVPGGARRVAGGRGRARRAARRRAPAGAGGRPAAARPHRDRRGRPAAGGGPGADRSRPAGWPPPTTCARRPATARGRARRRGREDAVDDARALALALVGEARHRLAGAGDAELAALDARARRRAGAARRRRGRSSPATSTGSTPTRSGSRRVLGRQAELKALTRKYAADIDGVLAWAEHARERLERLDTSDEALAALAARRDALAAELAEHAAAVTAARTAAAARLADGHHRRAGRAGDARRAAAGRGHAARGRARGRRRAAGRRCARSSSGADGVDEVELRLVAHAGRDAAAAAQGRVRRASCRG